MGLLGAIFEKLGMGNKPSPASAERANGAAQRASVPTQSPTQNPQSAPSQPKPVMLIDVVQQLEQRAAKNPQKLNWKSSIVDLLKLLDIDSSSEARKQLAKELGGPPEVMNDSAKMNLWLHKTVLEKIADNGGNVPRELLA